MATVFTTDEITEVLYAYGYPVALRAAQHDRELRD